MSPLAVIACAAALFVVYALIAKWRLDRRPKVSPLAVIACAAALFVVYALIAKPRLDHRSAARAHRPTPQHRTSHS